MSMQGYMLYELDHIVSLLLQLSDTLDNTQDLLTMLFEQLSQAEPISFYVDVLKNQSSDNIALLNDLNSRQPVLLDLLMKAQMLRSASAEQNTGSDGKGYRIFTR